MKTYRDHYFLKARREHYPARSIYKLQEMDKRFRLFRPGMRVLDLGAAPGSWSLGAAERVGPKGLVIGADIRPPATPFPPQVRFLREDIFAKTQAFADMIREEGPFDVVLSDMAPNTTGHRATDQARSAALCGEALALAVSCLIKGGSFVVKVFMGPEVKSYLERLGGLFQQARAFKPAGSRPESMETFAVALGFRGLPPPAAGPLPQPSLPSPPG
ncbi:MAG: RlmE family RNA methyltransferase [Desulfovibrio sp.]|nr:RlmE family RNA methyltransferase [Desulfovibrio sp.]